MDLAQSRFECCAINYDTNLWKMQALGKKDLTVPLTGCWLANGDAPKAYLDQKPANLTQCQALQPHEYAQQPTNLARRLPGDEQFSGVDGADGRAGHVRAAQDSAEAKVRGAVQAKLPSVQEQSSCYLV